ncbi:MazG-like family protein [Nonomuraea sp. NPDC049028]|uniref:MazG-like family protein n=1 Tax=Nonomuraea sp. NPDC049028 TaxID=3364348 RepID=UPI003717C170
MAWLDHNNGRDDHEITLRIMKIGEEFGEAVQARIGELGQNPRKPASHTREDVADELCDVIVTAMVALGSVVDDPQDVFQSKLRKISDRVAALEASRA